MGNKLVNIYKDYIDREFKNETIKKFVNAVLEKADDANAENPASSSGKYHPISDMGPGGNVRHSILVAEITKVMMRAYPIYDDENNRELMVASAILHDVCKYNSNDMSHTQFEHPVLAAKLISDVGHDLSKENTDYANIAFVISTNVATHMGRWNTSKYSKEELPQPTDLSQKLLHLADLVSANKELPNTIKIFTDTALEEIKGGEQ